MANNLNLLDTLKKFNSIRLNVEAKDWQDAVYQTVKPLIDCGAILEGYYHDIIDSTKEHGPYYIIADGLAMPHAQSGFNVKENSFSLITLKNSVKFDNDSREIKVLIGLAATSAEIHTSQALPQIVAVFEDPVTVEKIYQCKTIDDVYSIIEKVDLMKYIS